MHKETILLVDDDVDFVRSTADLLEGHGYKILTAHDGEEGFALARDAQPDLMVLDVMMATTTQGFEVARKIPACPELRNMPVLLVTGIRSEMQLGFRLEPNETWLPVSRIMEKPIDPATFVTTVGELLRRRGEMDAEHGMNRCVRDILAAKDASLITIAPDITVRDAVAAMDTSRIGSLLVTQGDSLAGICTERDCLQVILDGKDPESVTVQDVMTPEVISVTSHETIEECMSLMTHKRVRHLPVVDAGNLVGVISIGDVVRTTVAEKNFIIEQLENYITTG